MKVVCAEPVAKPQPKGNCKYDISQGKIVCDGPKPAKEICEWDNYSMKVVCRKVDEPKPVHKNDPPSEPCHFDYTQMKVVCPGDGGGSTGGGGTPIVPIKKPAGPCHYDASVGDVVCRPLMLI